MIASGLPRASASTSAAVMASISYQTTCATRVSVRPPERREHLTEALPSYLFPRLRVEGDLPYRHPTVAAGVGTVLIRTRIMSTINIRIMILGGWVRVGYARLCGVHEAPPRGPGSEVRLHLRGHFIMTPSLYTRMYHKYTINRRSLV